MKLEAKKKNWSINDAIKEKGKKLIPEARRRLKGLKRLENDKQESSHASNAQFLVNRWHKDGTSFEPVRFLIDLWLNNIYFFK